MFDTVAVAGATGAVGTLIIRMFQERKFPYKKMKFLASKRSVGQSYLSTAKILSSKSFAPRRSTGST